MMPRKLEHATARATSERGHPGGNVHGSRARTSREMRGTEGEEILARLRATIATQAEELERTRKELEKAMSRGNRLERRFLEICERERRRFGQELHDDTCQTLGGLAWITSKAGRDTMNRDPESAHLFCAIAQELNDALDQTYRIAQGLHPTVLRTRGLGGALACVAERASERIPCVLKMRDGIKLPPAIELGLYRISQEAVTNAVKHSRASRIEIALHETDEALVLTIEDNGRGLDVLPHASRGMGRDIMEYRAHAMGAELTIESRNGRGTLVRCVLPTSVEWR